MNEVLSVSDKGGIVVATIDRERVRNAISREVLDSILDLLKLLESNKGARVLIMTGQGEQAFSAGADLKERLGMDQGETMAFVEKIQSTFQAISNLSIPCIAAINGDAFGGGLELALACDIRVMNKDAYVGLIECGLGIIPGAGGTQRLPRLIGLSRAMEVVLLAKRVSGEEALSLGLVDHLADGAADCRAQAMELARGIAKNAPLAVKAAKRAILGSQELSLSSGLEEEFKAYREILPTKDRLEGLEAFREKRSPIFTGE